MGYFQGETISRMPSGAIIHDKNFRECVALNNIATLNSANFHREDFHELSSIHEIRKNFPSKITHYIQYAITHVQRCCKFDTLFSTGSDDNSSTSSSGMIVGFIIFGLIVLIVMLLGAFGIYYILKKREQGVQNEEGSMQQNTNKTSGNTFIPLLL